MKTEFLILNFALEELVRDPGNSNNNNTRTSLEKVYGKKFRAAFILQNSVP